MTKTKTHQPIKTQSTFHHWAPKTMFKHKSLLQVTPFQQQKLKKKKKRKGSSRNQSKRTWGAPQRKSTARNCPFLGDLKSNSLHALINKILKMEPPKIFWTGFHSWSELKWEKILYHEISNTQHLVKVKPNIKHSFMNKKFKIGPQDIIGFELGFMDGFS